MSHVTITNLAPPGKKTYLISGFVVFPREDREISGRGIVDVTLLNFRRVVQHVCEGCQQSNRSMIRQHKIHPTTPYSGESPLILREREMQVSI